MDSEALKKIIPEKYIFLNEPMKNHTTIHIGGRVRAFITVPSCELLAKLAAALKKDGDRFMITGNASNLLFSDEDMDLIVLSTDTRNSEISSAGLITQTNEDSTPFPDSAALSTCGGGAPGDSAIMVSGAGCMLGNLAMKAAGESLGGLEFASGIPGTVGGAVAMNAGAYGGEIKDVILGAWCLDRDGRKIFLNRDELQLSYRNSAVLKNGLTVLKAYFLLHKKNKEEILSEMRDLNKRRRDKQPLEYPSCGSTFKRPEGAYAAALIDEAGLKGTRVGDMEISEKHAGFMVNRGNGTCRDALSLIKLVQKKVFEKSGIMLEPEIRIVR